MTIFFRNLSQLKKEDDEETALAIVFDSFYKPEEVVATIKESWLYWFTLYSNRLTNETIRDEDRKIAMDSTNPKYVLRNYMAQLAIEAAEKEDYSIIAELHTLLKHPYQEQEKYSKWFAKRPDWAREKIGSSMLSCSS
jgi:uncharacterized protein YdiU (UPF0061 family)